VQKLASQTVVQAVPDLVSMAVAIGGPRADNTTALAISWQGADNAGASGPNVISTELLPEDQVSSTIGNAAAAPDAALDADPFDEDAIEKAIAEINQAIEKSSQLLK
jgi:protein phosphatase